MSQRFASRFVRLGACVCLALLPGLTFADQIYVSVQGARIGVFKGSSNAKGMEGKIIAGKFALQVSTPGVGGRRQYSALRLTKLVDASSPQFFQALITGDALIKVTIDFVTQGASQQPVLARNVVLQNARVVGVDQYTEPDPSGGVRMVEEVSLAIARIEINDVASQTQVMDDVVRN